MLQGSGGGRRAPGIADCDGAHDDEEQVLEIPLPNASWPLLPPDRYNVPQLLLQLACTATHTAGQAMRAGLEHHQASGGASSCDLGATARQGSAGQELKAHKHAVQKIKAHKHVKSNPFDLVLEPPEETEVVGRWLLGDGTRGVLRELCCLDPLDPDRGVKLACMLEIHGGPWLLDHCRFQSNGGAVLRLSSVARALCLQSVIEGSPSLHHVHALAYLLVRFWSQANSRAAAAARILPRAGSVGGDIRERWSRRACAWAGRQIQMDGGGGRWR
jgi:hypothetical protein